jgi:hypothetical protein
LRYILRTYIYAPQTIGHTSCCSIESCAVCLQLLCLKHTNACKRAHELMHARTCLHACMHRHRCLLRGRLFGLQVQLIAESPVLAEISLGLLLLVVMQRSYNMTETTHAASACTAELCATQPPCPSIVMRQGCRILLIHQPRQFSKRQHATWLLVAGGATLHLHK